jgi:ATP-binding cassette subfamily C protein CydD
LLRQFTQARNALLLTVGFGVLGTIATIAQMAFLSRIVSRVFLFHEGLAQVELLVFLLCGTIVLRAGLVWCREIAAQRGAIRVKAAVRNRLFAHLLQLGPAYSKGERTGELVATASAGVELLDAYISRYVPQMVLSVLVPLLIVLFIFPLDWSSALLLLVTGPIIPLLMVLVGSYAEKHMQHQWLALARISAYFLDAVQGLTTLKLFGRSTLEDVRIARFSDLFRERTMKTLRIAFLSGMVLEFLSTSAIGLIAVTLGIRLLNGNIAFEQAFLILLLTPEFYRPLRELGVHRHAGMEGKIAAQRISEILETPLPAHTGETSAHISSRQLTVELTNVTYSYPGQSHAAVKEVSLTLPVGSCTALVGRSGAGKSTLINLLLRFMDAQDGTITVNGVALTDLPVETWREYVALVPQRPYLFYGSVRANIRLARPMASDQEVEQAAQLAGATEFIQQLPQGYETEIGEQGLRLSAGQAQRLAIARAFLKDAPLLLLDEPTSSLDPISESCVKNALAQLMQNRTVLVIAHRYNTIQAADAIAVMEDGRLVEVGQREELLQRHGAYARLMGEYKEASHIPTDNEASASSYAQSVGKEASHIPTDNEASASSYAQSVGKEVQVVL